MPNRSSINTWLLALAISLVLGVCWQVSNVAPSIAASIRRAREDKMSEIQWPAWVSGGKTYSIKSVRENGESTGDFIDRAVDEYEALRERFPEDNEK